MTPTSRDELKEKLYNTLQPIVGTVEALNLSPSLADLMESYAQERVEEFARNIKREFQFSEDAQQSKIMLRTVEFDVAQVIDRELAAMRANAKLTGEAGKGKEQDVL